MGIYKDSNLFTVYGAKDVVKEITANVARTLSKYSIKDKPIRGYNIQTKELEHKPLKVIYTYPESIKMYKLRTEDDYFIELTEDCEIYTPDGWISVADIQVGQIIWANGSAKPPYMDKENLKKLYVDMGKSQREIGEMYGVAERTIRGYVDKFGLHRGDAGAKFGEDNPNWRGVNVTKDGGYSRTHNITDKIKKGVCDRCGFEGDTDIHHDDRNPTNTSSDNLIELCKMCHKAEHLGAPVRWIRPAKIIEKMYGGYDKTYGFDTELGNVVANGYIVRFSSENADVKCFEVE